MASNQGSLNSFISLWDKTDINVHCLCGILMPSRASLTDSSEVNIHNMWQTIDLNEFAPKVNSNHYGDVVTSNAIFYNCISYHSFGSL